MSIHSESPAVKSPIDLNHEPTRLLLEELRPLLAEQQAAIAEYDALNAATDRAEQRCTRVSRQINRQIRALAEINGCVQRDPYGDYDLEATGKLVDGALAQLAATSEAAA